MRFQSGFFGLMLSVMAFCSWGSACPYAQPNSAPGFCASFKTAAQCHCQASGLPASMCTNMQLIYSRMISVFGSVQRACAYQSDTSVQECIDDWSCYRSGGLNSQQQLCSGTGQACG